MGLGVVFQSRGWKWPASHAPPLPGTSSRAGPRLAHDHVESLCDLGVPVVEDVLVTICRGGRSMPEPGLHLPDRPTETVAKVPAT